VRNTVTPFVLVLLAQTAFATPPEDAKVHFNRGLGAFALGHYAQAAEEYEAAFALKADPVLLYDAAQAHRLAGHHERALTLYQNYLRVFGKRAAYHENVERHVVELQRVLAEQKHASESPPTEIAQPVAPPVAPPPAVTPPPAHLETTPPTESKPRNLFVQVPERNRPVYKKKWFWGVTGGGVVAIGLGIGLGIGLAPAKAPTPSLGRTTVQ
jgi:hypothetical protein